jgi:long-chain acyl-CoA synthetase
MATLRTVPAHFAAARDRYGNRPVLTDRAGSVGLVDLLDDATALAAGLRAAGVERGDRVGFAADNSRRWILADLAIHLAGAISVPRGTDTPPDELAVLFRHADVGLVLAHDAREAAALEAVRDRIPSMKEIVPIDPAGAPGRTLDDLLREGRGRTESFAEAAARVAPEDVATIIYTSGTTGRPKGVVLTQANFGHQCAVVPPLFDIGPEEVFLSVLPPWHIFERTVEYVALTSGARLVYTDRRRFKEDFAQHEPTFVPSVPRIWETVYDGVKKALAEGPALKRVVFRTAYATASAYARSVDAARGHVLRIRHPRGAAHALHRAGAAALAALTWAPARLAHATVLARVRRVTGNRLRGAISGGGLMPTAVDRFFRDLEIPILVGYGLTETSPVVTVRRAERNVLGTIGTLVPEVEVQIRHLDTGRVLGPGETGIIVTRGPHVMRGYHRDEEMTRRVIDAEGWFDTGDLGSLTEEGDLLFRGRAKETIVLSGGENVEPTHVEEAIARSPLVEQVVVVGQDRKALAALVVPAPGPAAAALGLDPPPERAALAADERLRDLVRRETIRRTSALRPFERVTHVSLLPEVLEPANGCMTPTMKLRRHVIVERFADRIDAAYGT